MIGWLVYTAAKPIVGSFVKSKAKSAVPGEKGSRSRLPKVAGVLAAIGATVGAVAFWRSRSGGEDSPGEDSPGEG